MKKYALIVSCAFLSACTTYNDGKPLAKMTFEHVQAYPVYAASYEVVPYHSEGSLVLPQTFVANPAIFTRDYLTNRYEAVGSQGKFRATIQSVKVEHERLSSENKVGSVIGVAGMDLYKVEVQVSMEALGMPGYERQGSTITARREIKVSEYVSIIERERLQMQALDALVDDLDVAMRKILKNEFHLIK